jgi:small subunit ribosomal protein S4e
MKKIAAPRSWNLPRKDRVWIAKPMPGPHHIEAALPLITVIKDVLHKAAKQREAEKIIKAGEITVDGRKVLEPKFPVGFMDVITIPKAGEAYRIVYDSKSRLKLRPIKKEQAGFKLCRIEDKHTAKGGKIQLSLHDGRVQFVDKGKFSPGDVLKIAVPDAKILECFELKEGNTAFITGGSNAGRVGRIAGIQPGTFVRMPLVVLDCGGERVTTLRGYTFVVGGAKPEIELEG